MNTRQHYRYCCLFLLLSAFYIVKASSAFAQQAADDWAAPLMKANALLSDKKYNQAFKVYQREAKKGNGLAQFTVALFYKNAWGKSADLNKACDWFYQAALNNMPAAQQQLATCYLAGVLGSKEQALIWYEKAYKSGVYYAACQAGELYLTGKYAPLNKEKGLALCVEAANGGSIQAMVNLGEWYFNGKYVAQNMPLAFQIFQDAAKKHSPEAAYYLARYYDQGLYVKASTKEALHWYEQAASKGYTKAYLPTSALYLQAFERADIPKKEKLLAKTYLWASTAKNTVIESENVKLAQLILQKIAPQLPLQWKQELNSKIQKHLNTYHSVID